MQPNFGKLFFVITIIIRTPIPFIDGSLYREKQKGDTITSQKLMEIMKHQIDVYKSSQPPSCKD